MGVTSAIGNAVRTDQRNIVINNFTYGALGDDNTPKVSSDTTLGNEFFRDSRDFIDTNQPQSVTVTLVVEKSEANGNTARETGWLDASSGGNLYITFVISDIVKTSDVRIFIDSVIDFNVVVA